MDTVKTKAQIILTIVICILLYMHVNKPKVEQEALTMDQIEQKQADMQNNTNPLHRSAAAQAQKIMSTGDIAEIEGQMNSMGLLGQ